MKSITSLSCLLVGMTLNCLAANMNPTALSNSDILFLENRGQVRDQEGAACHDVRYIAQFGGVKVFIEANRLHYQFERMEEQDAPGLATHQSEVQTSRQQPKPFTVTRHRIDMELVGANPLAEVIPSEMNAYYENYYNLPSVPEGIENVRSFGRIVVKEVYPHIDWVIYSKDHLMKYDFVVRPGGDPQHIRMRYAGADLALREDGGLGITTPFGVIVDQAPITNAGFPKTVPTQFSIRGDVVSFELGDYDEKATLVIDPTVVWMSFYGGNGYDQSNATTTDVRGNVYFGGWTASTNIMGVGGSQTTWGGGNYDGWVVKVSVAGNRVWGSFYGGASHDNTWTVAADLSGNVFVGGETLSSTGIGFGGHQMTYGGGQRDGFLVKFDSTGIRLWGTYYGGGGEDEANSVEVDAAGNAYLAGNAQSHTGIASGGYQNSHGGNYFDAFLAKFNPAGVRQWGTYYGGTGDDWGQTVSVDASGNMFLGGFSNGNNAIGFNGYKDTLTGNFDAFMVKFNPALQRQWGTYFGGSAEDHGLSCSVDHGGNVYFGGHTYSNNGIGVGGHQSAIGGNVDGYLVKLAASGAYLWSTYYGGAAQDFVRGVAVDSNDNAIIGGFSGSVTGISSTGPPDTLMGWQDAYLAKFNPAGTRMWGRYSGLNYAGGQFVATDGFGNIYATGHASSNNGVLTGFQPINGGGGDAFIVKIHDDCSALPVARCRNVSLSLTGSNATLLASMVDSLSNSSCGNPLSLQVSPSAFTCSNLGANSVTLTVTDSLNASSSTCAAMVTVLDADAPAINCPPNDSVTATLGTCTAIVSFANATATDNCTGVTVTQTAGLPSGSSFPEGSSTVTFQAVDSAGNVSSCSLMIVVVPANATTQTITACAGFSLTVGNHTYAQSGTYSDTLVAGSGCDSVVTTILTIAPPIDTTVTVSNPTIMANATAAAYQWLDCMNGMAPITGATAQTFSPIVNGTYAVQLTVGNCTDTSACAFVVAVAVAESWSTQIRLLPNPNSGNCLLDFGTIAAHLQVRIIDMLGREVFATEATGQAAMSMDTRMLACGMYFVEVRSEQEKAILQMIKE